LHEFEELAITEEQPYSCKKCHPLCAQTCSLLLLFCCQFQCCTHQAVTEHVLPLWPICPETLRE